MRQWWYHLGFGLIVAAWVVVFFLTTGIGPGLATFCTVVAGTVLGRWSYRRRPDSGGRPTRLYLLTLVVTFVVLVGILLATWYLVRTQGLAWAAWVAAFAVFLLAVGGGYLADRARLSTKARSRTISAD